ncbi:hypothetical protein Tco_1286385 [Tanacetum coccineum]
MGRQVKTGLKLEKFRELCDELSNVDKEMDDVVEELERLSGNHVMKETARLLRRGQKRDLDKMTRLHIMVNESHLGFHEKHTFVSNMNLGTLVMTYKILKFLSEVQNHDVIKLLELRKMVLGTHQHASRKIDLIETMKTFSNVELNSPIAFS